MKNITNNSKVDKLFHLLQAIGVDVRMIPEDAYLLEDIGIKRKQLIWLRFRLQTDLGIEVSPKNLSLGKIKTYLSQNLH